MPETVEEMREEVAEDATPETNVEAVEQRADDYDGLARRIDDLREIMESVRDAVERVESTTAAFAVDAGAVISEDAPDTAEEVFEDAVEDAVEDVVEIEDLNLNMKDVETED